MVGNFSGNPLVNAERNALAGYRVYGFGVSLLSNPRETARMHNDSLESDPDRIIAISKEMMLLGLSDVIRYSNPDIEPSRGSARRPCLGKLENRFLDLLPNMNAVVDEVFEDKRFTKKMDELSPAFAAIRPAPMCIESIFKHICRSRKDKLKIMDLMGNVPISSHFGQLAYRSMEHPSTTGIQTPEDLTETAALEAEIAYQAAATNLN